MQGVLQARQGGTSLAMADQALWPGSAVATLQRSAQPLPAQQQQGVPSRWVVSCRFKLMVHMQPLAWAALQVQSPQLDLPGLA